MELNLNKMNIIKNNVAVSCDKNSRKVNNQLILSYKRANDLKYLNVLFNNRDSYAEIAEWLTHLIDTQNPFGYAGSIPALGVTNFKFLKEELIK